MSHPVVAATTTRTATPPHLRAWRNAVFVLFTLSGLSLASWVARLPAVRDELGLDTAAVGLLILGLSVGSILGLVISPHLLRILGPRAGILTSVGLGVLGLVGVGVSSTIVPNAALATLALAFLGLGIGSLDVMINLEGAGAERAIGRTLLPLMHAFFSLGTVIGAGLGAAASALNVPVFWHLLVIGLLMLGGAVIVVRHIPREVEAEPVATGEIGLTAAGVSAARPTLAQRLRESLSVWADRRLLIIGVVLLGMAFAEGSANDWIALATIDGHHADNTTGAIVFGIFVAAMTVGRVAGGPILDRFGRVPVLRWSALIGVTGLLLFILAPAFWVVVVGTVLWGLGASLGFPVGISAAADDPRGAAARVGAVAIIGYLAFLAGPPLLGFLGQHFGILNALFVVLVLLVAAALASPAARELTGRFARPQHAPKTERTP